MKQVIYILFFAFLAGCLDSSDDFGTGKHEVPVVPEGSEPDSLRPLVFQSSSFSGVMGPAAESLEDVENKAVRGCGGMDCIPAYSYPEVIGIKDASNIDDDDLVLGAYVNGEARAYPLSTLWSSEIANDTLGGVGLSVNYCPLTGTGLNFKGTLQDGTPVTFGVSGLLNNNNLILYDRQTFSFWPQMLFTSAWGEKKGEQIQLLPVMEITWKAWKMLFPNSTVVDNEFRGSYPYGSYYTNNDHILFEQSIDKRLGTKDLVMGVIGDKTVKAYPFKNMKSLDVINDVVDGVPILVLYSDRAQSAQVFERPVVSGTAVHFLQSDPSAELLPEVVSSELPGRWNFAGINVTDSGTQDLKPVVTAFKGFWLSWGVYYNVTEIYGL